MPFKKGQSGNPLGRKVKSAEHREVANLAKKCGADAIARLKFWMGNDDGRISVAAANALLDRGYGKPAQAITGEGGGPVALGISWLPPSE